MVRVNAGVMSVDLYQQQFAFEFDVRALAHIFCSRGIPARSRIVQSWNPNYNDDTNLRGNWQSGGLGQEQQYL